MHLWCAELSAFFMLTSNQAKQDHLKRENQTNTKCYKNKRSWYTFPMIFRCSNYFEVASNKNAQHINWYVFPFIRSIIIFHLEIMFIMRCFFSFWNLRVRQDIVHMFGHCAQTKASYACNCIISSNCNDLSCASLNFARLFRAQF